MANLETAISFSSQAGASTPPTAIVRQIASFLSLSDAASLGASAADGLGGPIASWSSFLTTPDTPGIMALSPDESTAEGDFTFVDDEMLHKRLHDRQRRYVTQKLAAAVFSHPNSLRSFCSKAHSAATAIQKSREQPETLREVVRPNIFQVFFTAALQNVPLSVVLDLLDSVCETLLDTSFASVTITVNSIDGLIHAVVKVLESIWDAVTNLRFSSAGDVLVSGIQSVATGVGSAALNRLSRDHVTSTASLRELNAGNKLANQQLLEKLSVINAAAQVIAYREREDEALTRHARKRVQRMMHYDVSLRPFVATVVVPPDATKESLRKKNSRTSFANVDWNSPQGGSPDSNTTPPSPFMCTPKSFPPTPDSRRLVMARGTKFAEDVLFLARDKLRVEDGLDSENPQTRAMAMALRESSRLAVFNAADVGNGMELSCGQHVATKIGTEIYCSTRSMVPVLRNCYAYFEMTVLPSGGNLQSVMATLFIGVSTLEMPLNTLVGAWKGSIGLCTTGQILAGGTWCSPADPSQSCFGENSTIGCLVCLDDGSAFETWDGVMVAASITFNVNGVIVTPPLSSSTTIDDDDGGDTSDDSSERQPPTAPGIWVPVEEELFPTLTLHSPGTQVMCRFSSQDILATSAEQVGAPEGASVFAVDGSVLF